MRANLVAEHHDVAAITRQYAGGPILYGILIGVGALNSIACLVLSSLIAIYFLLPPSLWRKTPATPASVS